MLTLMSFAFNCPDVTGPVPVARLHFWSEETGPVTGRTDATETFWCFGLGRLKKTESRSFWRKLFFKTKLLTRENTVLRLSKPFLETSFQLKRCKLVCELTIQYLAGRGEGGQSVAHPLRGVGADGLALAELPAARAASFGTRAGRWCDPPRHAHHALDMLADPPEPSNVACSTTHKINWNFTTILFLFLFSQ